MKFIQVTATPTMTSQEERVGEQVDRGRVPAERVCARRPQRRHLEDGGRFRGKDNRPRTPGQQGFLRLC